MDLFATYSIIAFVAYLGASLAIITRLFHPQGPNQLLVLLIGCFAIIAHTLGVSQQMFLTDEVNFSLPYVISLVSLIITMSISVVATRFKVNLLLPVIYGFAGIWQLLLVLMPGGGEIPLTAEKALLISHITLALIAYCVLVIATLYAFQVAYINFKLKSKNLAAVNQLPPLMQVENQLFLILAIGTLCLFISEVSGFIFLENFLAKDKLHKTVLSLVALAIYSITLFGHFKRGWRGHRVLILTICATSLLTLSYFGSRFVKEFLLS
ncbi:cytochrome C assembly family protein [Thalassomonas actiniarum]|uniref:Cytochrome c biogenesis protein CcsA n=1 Tax=Thalassomonas actiniarum TaxID=485447 RepID=A0AAE9YSX5_9GAMM|nr:cytochrome c biogenesis protein CcsA [Thalassomonas actiniarum]WDE00153.1 cytochrome c biogenesis protein CcsA [Thalassomonas actiniarum]